MSYTYVHGYQPRENERLQHQAGTLVELVHGDTLYPAGRGCSRPAVASAPRRSRSPPGAPRRRSPASTSPRHRWRRPVGGSGTPDSPTSRCSRATSTTCRSPRRPSSTCSSASCSSTWIARSRLRHLLRPGGSLTVVEGDHGSAYFHPDDELARAAIACQVHLQACAGGDALIGRQVYPLLVKAGFHEVYAAPRVVYVDSSRPDLVEGFTRRTFTAMVAAVRDDAVAAGLTTEADFDAGVRALERTTEPDGVFSYTFIKGVGLAPA